MTNCKNPKCEKPIGQKLHIKLKEPIEHCNICNSDIYEDYIFCNENCLKEYLRELEEVKSNLTESFDIQCEECEKDISKELHYELHIPEEKNLECNHSEYSEYRFCSKECIIKYIEKHPKINTPNLTPEG